jgi:hypothetical protein
MVVSAGHFRTSFVPELYDVKISFFILWTNIHLKSYAITYRVNKVNIGPVNC